MWLVISSISWRQKKQQNNAKILKKLEETCKFHILSNSSISKFNVPLLETFWQFI